MTNQRYYHDRTPKCTDRAIIGIFELFQLLAHYAEITLRYSVHPDFVRAQV
jgi:hypothetical protein